MPSSLNQLALASANTGTNGAYTQVTSVSVPATGTAVIPHGVYMAPIEAALLVQVQTATSGTWSTVYSGTGGFLFSDGVNTRFQNTSGAAVTGTLYNPGSAVDYPGTYA